MIVSIALALEAGEVVGDIEQRCVEFLPWPQHSVLNAIKCMSSVAHVHLHAFFNKVKLNRTCSNELVDYAVVAYFASGASSFIGIDLEVVLAVGNQVGHGVLLPLHFR